MRLFRVLTLCATALPSALVAQEAPSTILVLDGSGSMWGQIDGKAKITIAQSVVGDLLGTLPDDINLGLTVYGHREKGNCRDIETIVAPAPGTRATIASAVAGIKPKGKTPLSDAVRQAAESLRYTEEKATVILVSDGRETCDADPCAVGRALEEAGVDFTTHVVGFDVSGDEVARTQLQCLAEATGGTYVQADDANTLSQALIAIAEEPEPVAVSITFRALDGDNGPVLSSDILWTLTDDTGAQTRLDGAMPDLSLFDGAYTASALRLTDEEERETQFTVAGSTLDVTVTFPFALPSATVTGPETAVIGSTIEVSWDGPAGDGDFVSVHEVNGDVWPINYSAISNGNPLALRMPGQPGQYELRYQIARDRTVIARTPIEITDALVTMEAPDSAEIGATIQIQWTGPDHRGDFISVHEVNGDVWPINYTATNEGTPLDLRMPSIPGDYEIRYQLAEEREVIYRQPITITEAQLAITVPERAEIGQTISVTWTGPDNRGDFISVHDTEGDVWPINYTGTKEGSPLELRMPSTPGDYEIRYQLAEEREVVHRVPITITETQVNLTHAPSAGIGESIKITWIGPNNEGDFISVHDAGGDVWPINHTGARDGSPLTLRMPSIPGDYEIRYQLAEERAVVARTPISVTPVEVTLTAPASGKTDSHVTVDWTGPGNRGDFISIHEVGGDVWGQNNESLRDGSSVELHLPETPGAYEIRYQLAEERAVIARIPITVTE